MFWNCFTISSLVIYSKLTVNMKCFEILLEHNNHQILFDINRKHEMFWNAIHSLKLSQLDLD